MKNLLSKIKVLTFFSALTLFQNIKAQNSADSLNKKDFIKIGAGQYLWDNNEFVKITQFSLENEMSITKNASLNFGFDYGTQQNKLNDQEYGLTKFSIRFGLNNYFLISDNKKIFVYSSFGINYILISENPTKIRDGTAIGLDYGGGIETLLNQKTKFFLEIKLNKSEIKGYKNKINIGGTSLMAGLKITIPQNKSQNNFVFEGDFPE